MRPLEPEPGRRMRWGKPPGGRGGSIAVGLVDEPRPWRFSLAEFRRRIGAWGRRVRRKVGL